MAIKTNPVNVNANNDTTYAELSITIPNANDGTSIFLSMITDTTVEYTQYTKVSINGASPTSPHDPVTDFELGRGADLRGKYVLVQTVIEKLNIASCDITYELEAGSTLLQNPADVITGVNGTQATEFINVKIYFN